MRRSTRRPGQAGFTVLEVLLAQLVFAFVVASTAALHLAAMTQGAVSRRAVEAAALAQEELEQIRDMPYDQILSAGPTPRTVGAHTYVLERVVTNDDPAANMKRIRIIVTWNIRGPRTYVAETIFTSLSQ